MGWDCLSFFIEQNKPPPYPIPLLGIEDIPRCPDRDVRMMAGQPCPDTWDDILSRYPAGRPTET